jgi:hypothetical protein
VSVLVFVALAGVVLSACSLKTNSKAAANRDESTASSISLSDDEKHKLYTSALAATDSPLDSELFKEVCKKIGIFNAKNEPNDRYMSFVQTHIEWAAKPEADQFRREINTQQKAQAYVTSHLR